MLVLVITLGPRINLHSTAVQCSTMHHNAALQHRSVQCSSEQSSVMQFCEEKRIVVHWRGELHRAVSHKSVWLFPICQGHQRPVNDTRDMSAIQHSCLGWVSQVYSVWTVKLKLRTANFWLKKVDSQLARLKYLLFGNQELGQLELWNLAQQEILSIVPGKVLWRKCIVGLSAKIYRALMWNNHRSPSPSMFFFGRHHWWILLQSTDS